MLICGTPSPCFTFHSIESEVIKDTIQTKILATGRPEACVGILGRIEASFEIDVFTSGEYTFSFWKSDEETVNTTLFIPEYIFLKAGR